MIFKKSYFISLLFLSIAFSVSCAKATNDSSHLGGQNPIYEIIESSDTELVKQALLESDEQNYPLPHLSRLEQASIFGFADVVQLLFDQMSDKSQLNAGNSLYSAASLGRLNIVSLILEKGVSPDFKLDSGFTPLYAAVQFGHDDIVLKLLEYGADINYRPESGLGLVSLGVVEKRLGTVCLILSKGYDVPENESKLIKGLEC